MGNPVSPYHNDVTTTIFLNKLHQRIAANYRISKECMTQYLFFPSIVSENTKEETLCLSIRRQLRQLLVIFGISVGVEPDIFSCYWAQDTYRNDRSDYQKNGKSD